MAMYGISDSSQLSSLFGTGESSFRASEAVKAPNVSTGTFLYGVNTAKPSSQDQTLLALKTGASDLKSALNALTDSTRDSVFSKMSAESSDQSVASAEMRPGRARTRDVELSVTQLAAGQTSETNVMRAGELNFEEGVHRIALTGADGGGSRAAAREIEITVEPDDTNESVLRKFADAVNARRMGVQAEVTFGEGTVSMSVNSVSTGQRSAFELSDAEGSFVAVTGMSVSSQAQNAEYTVDGAARSSQTNSVTIGGKADVALKGAGSAKLTFGRDMSAVSDAVTGFVSAYNELTASNEKMSAQMAYSAASYADALSAAGFQFDNGNISITDEALEKSLSSGAMRSLFSGGENYGYSARLSQLSQVAERAPQLFSAQTDTYSFYNAERLNTQQSQVSFMLGLFYNTFI
ncbi:MAG: flagellar filament capping protein FliD [Oscillospiraceae bacterium]|nr:flagellar filament capping protein FliD [Oscillospiraceae bacterium]